MTLADALKMITAAAALVPGLAALTNSFVPPSGRLMFGLLGEVTAAAAVMAGILVARLISRTGTPLRVGVVMLLLAAAVAATWAYGARYTAVVHTLPLRADQARDLLVPLPLENWLADAPPELRQVVLCEKQLRTDQQFDCASQTLQGAVSTSDIVFAAEQVGPSVIARFIPDEAEADARRSLLMPFVSAVLLLVLGFTVGAGVVAVERPAHAAAAPPIPAAPPAAAPPQPDPPRVLAGGAGDAQDGPG